MLCNLMFNAEKNVYAPVCVCVCFCMEKETNDTATFFFRRYAPWSTHPHAKVLSVFFFDLNSSDLYFYTQARWWAKTANKNRMSYFNQMFSTSSIQQRIKKHEQIRQKSVPFKTFILKWYAEVVQFAWLFVSNENAKIWMHFLFTSIRSLARFVYTKGIDVKEWKQ